MAFSQRLRDCVDTITGKYERAALGPESESLESAEGSSRACSPIDSDETKHVARWQNDEALTAENTTRIWTPVIVSTMLFLASFVFQYYVEWTSDQACASLMETWSPMRNLIDHEWRQFDSESCPEAFCGGYDEHRDESWKTSWDVGWHGLNREKLPLLHRTNRTGWLHLLPPQSEDSLPSMPGFLHQMHCLSLLREALHRDEFSYVGNTKLNRLAFEWHTNHCLLALDTIIRCKADISPILLEEIEQTWPANGTVVSQWKLRDPVKRCRKYEPLRRWVQENAVCSSGCNSGEIYGIEEHIKDID